jgi:PKD repeat protein
MPANPLITSASSASGTVGVSFSYTITATNGPASYTASNLPAGISLKGNNIVGRPTKSGNFNVTVSASNSGGTGTKVVRITVTNPVPVITSPATAKGKLNSNFSYKIQVSNSPQQIIVTSLPSGLKFNSKTNVISGKPTKSGKFTIRVTAKNKFGSASKNVVVTVTK